MINEIICIGTSFTEGDGLNPYKDDSAVKWYKEHKGIEIESITQFSWPSQLQKISGIKTRNLGKCGSSIEYLMRNVEEIIEKEDVSDKIFILEYSSWGRSELWSTKHNKWIVANWGPRNGQDALIDGYSVMMTTDYNFGQQLEPNEFKIYESFLDNYFNESEYLIQRDIYFLNLLYKLNSKNIKYKLLILEPVYSLELENDSLFKDNLIINQNLWEFMDKNKLSIKHITSNEIDNGHPSIEGHERLSSIIYTKLKERGDLE